VLVTMQSVVKTVFCCSECGFKTHPRYRCKFFIYTCQNIKPSSLNLLHSVHSTLSDCSLPKSKKKVHIWWSKSNAV